MKKSFVISLFLGTILLSVFYQCKTEESVTKGSEAHIAKVTTAVDDEMIVNADKHMGDWLTYGRDYDETRYSELNQINKDNLEKLGLAWTIELGDKRGVNSTPIVVDGIMFLTASWSVAYAIDTRSGTIIWKYDPQVPRAKAIDICCGVTNRGPAIYKGSLIWGTLDGRLVSVDAAKGTLNWEVMTVPNEKNDNYSITGAPRIVKGNVIIGNGGAEFNARGFVTAYDAETGEQQWRFYTVPGNPDLQYENPILEEAAKTWTGTWWTQGGGGTVWDAIVYDSELDQLYLGVGNGTHWDRKIRSPEGGDNLFLSSIVALNPDDGKYIWHYQTTPGDSWDYTATQPITLADLEIDGTQRKVLMQAPKNGFFYVIDRTNGELISGENFVYMNWATGIDENGRPIETPTARYTDGKTYWMTPGSHGGHNWHPQSFSKRTGYMYIPACLESGPYTHNPEWSFDEKEAAGGTLGANVSLAGKLYVPPVIDPKAPLPGVASGKLIAWDPVTQKEVWSVAQPHHYNAGLLTTSTGLLFQADAEGRFSARDDMTGEVLWQYDIRNGGIAPPVTYEVDGEQYITINVSWGGGQGQISKMTNRLHPGTVYTFKIGGNATPPVKLPDLETNFTTIEPTSSDPIHIGNGLDLFVRSCIGCHNTPGAGGGVIPDLTTSGEGVVNSWNDIVLGGMLASQGMPNFSEYLSEEDVAEIKDYVLYTSKSLREGKAFPELLQELAGYQYLSDQNPPIRKDIR